jgi:viologen exporter family transport system ATP-binding protein
VPLIEARGLTKVFRQADKAPGLKGSLRHLVARAYTDKVAVDHVDLSVDPGEAVAYVGPNGAGKSTTVKLLSGILVPTAGDVLVDGRVAHRRDKAVMRRMGLMFGQRTQLWLDLPVSESLNILREIYGVERSVYAERLAQFDEVLGLGEFLGVAARRLSLGQRVRADLAATFLHGPDLVYLDEPTIGLDIAVKDRVRAFLRTLRDDGTTIMLTSHDLEDIEEVCGRLVIIDEGRIIFDGDMTSLKDRFARDRLLHVQVATPIDIGELESRLPGTELIEGESTLRLAIRFDRLTRTAGSVVAAVASMTELVDFHLDEPAVEDVIRRVYAGTLQLPTPAVPA